MAKKKKSKDKEDTPSGEDIMNSLRKIVQQLLPRRIEFVLAKTAAGARPKSVNEEIFTREVEDVPANKPEPVNERNKEEEKESGLQLFKKPTKKRFGDSKTEGDMPVVSKSSQIVSNTAREWLNLPKRKFAASIPEKRAVSKPLPSEEELASASETKRDLPNVLKQVVKKSKKREERIKPEEPVQSTDAAYSDNVYDWGEEKSSFEHVIESKRHEALKEWEEMRKPDEWDMALDQGKQRKVRKNKAFKKNSKANPFQTVAEKKQKRKN